MSPIALQHSLYSPQGKAPRCWGSSCHWADHPHGAILCFHCPDASLKPHITYHSCFFNTPTEYSLKTATRTEAFKRVLLQLMVRNMFPLPSITYVYKLK